MNISFDGYEIKIIWKLHRNKCYGAKHTSIDHLKQGVPSHLGVNINEAINKLVQKQIIIIEKKTKEDHVCLNKKKVDVINKIVDWFPDNAKKFDKKHLEKTFFEIEIK